MARCEFCGESFSNTSNVRRHQTNTPACLKQLDAKFGKLLRARRRQPAVPETDPEATAVEHPADATSPTQGLLDDGPSTETDDVEPDSNTVDEDIDPDQDAVSPPPRIIEVEDEEAPRRRWREPYSEAAQAGCGMGSAKTTFEEIRDDQVLRGAEILGPFADNDEWQLAKWLIKNVGHNQTEAFLKLPIIQNRAKPSYRKKDNLLDLVDELPAGVKWEGEELTIVGDVPDLEKDPNGDKKIFKEEQLEMWYRDPVEVVRELLGNPMFCNNMAYAPEHLYADAEGENRIYEEMSTGDWWWKVQQLLPKGATIAPLIISSDKTQLSRFRGDKAAWPVYLTVGNIDKETRREVSSRATILIAYLPIPKFDCFTAATRSLAKYRLFHQCMSILTASPVVPGQEGVPMVCADRVVRRVWPILAAYVADYPEQCLISCCKENRCPICTVDPGLRGSHTSGAKREEQETIFYMRRKKAGVIDTAFITYGLRDISQPFWATLPHSDIFTSFTPDLLHQLHKGVFKDHLVKWCTEVIEKAELDARFKGVPLHPDLRHFKHGISTVSQWTGTEHKEMEKIFLGIVAGGPHGDTRVVAAVKGVIDFIYFASLQAHTSATLCGLRSALDEFHNNKQVFIDLEARTQGHFNIHKIHSMEHYADLIAMFGSADGFNTESPERLHIDCAKDAYAAGNRRDFIVQMCTWLQRQEAIDRFTISKIGQVRYVVAASTALRNAVIRF